MWQGRLGIGWRRGNGEAELGVWYRMGQRSRTAACVEWGRAGVGLDRMRGLTDPGTGLVSSGAARVEGLAGSFAPVLITC